MLRFFTPTKNDKKNSKNRQKRGWEDIWVGLGEVGWGKGGGMGWGKGVGWPLGPWGALGGPWGGVWGVRGGGGVSGPSYFTQNRHRAG